MNVNCLSAQPVFFLHQCFCVQIEALKKMSRTELVSWFQEHREQNSRKLSVHVRNAFMCVYVCVWWRRLKILCIIIHVCALLNTVIVSLSPQGGGIRCWGERWGRQRWKPRKQRRGHDWRDLLWGVQTHFPSRLTQAGGRHFHHGYSCFH